MVLAGHVQLATASPEGTMRFELHGPWLVAAIALSACAADPSDTAPYDLTIQADGLPASTFIILGLTEDDGDVLIANEGFPADDGSFAVTYGDILSPARGHDLFIFADLDDSGSCDAPPTDRPWRARLPAREGPTTVDLGQLELEPAACAYFAAQGL
jgi:hypothetical protein